MLPYIDYNLQLFIDDQNENNEKLVYMWIFPIFTFRNHMYCARLFYVYLGLTP